MKINKEGALKEGEQHEWMNEAKEQKEYSV